MYPALFALTLVIAPPLVQQSPATAPSTPTPPPVARPPTGVELRLGLRTSAPTATAAFTAVGAVISGLRDSLRARHVADSAVRIDLRTFAVSADHASQVATATVAVTVAPSELSNLPQILEVMQRSGSVVLPGTEAAATDSSPAAAGHSTVGRLSAIALLLLQIRREVKQ